MRFEEVKQGDKEEVTLPPPELVGEEGNPVPVGPTVEIELLGLV